MPDLTTSYLGLSLSNPLVASSSPLTGDIDIARRLEDEGAAAIVMPSLFEEDLHEDQQTMHRFVDYQQIGHGEAESFLPQPVEYQSHLDQYLEKITRLKRSLSIPVIGSLNGVSLEGWLEHADDLQQAGCDALELNVYYVAADPNEPGSAVEDRYVEILEKLCARIDLPVGVKISPYFSSVANLVCRLEQAGAQGVSLFNRFYQPDIDLQDLEVKPRIYLSSTVEALERVRWIALLDGQIQMNIAATGGFHRSA